MTSFEKNLAAVQEHKITRHELYEAGSNEISRNWRYIFPLVTGITLISNFVAERGGPAAVFQPRPEFGAAVGAVSVGVGIVLLGAMVIDQITLLARHRNSRLDHEIPELLFDNDVVQAAIKTKSEPAGRPVNAYEQAKPAETRTAGTVPDPKPAERTLFISPIPKLPEFNRLKF